MKLAEETESHLPMKSQHITDDVRFHSPTATNVMTTSASDGDPVLGPPGGDLRVTLNWTWP